MSHSAWNHQQRTAQPQWTMPPPLQLLMALPASVRPMQLRDGLGSERAVTRSREAETERATISRGEHSTVLLPESYRTGQLEKNLFEKTYDLDNLVEGM